MTGRARTAPQVLLERRYRRLLRCYPASYRAASEDEMVGVALALARPGQRRPRPAEAASLVVRGLAMRVHVLLAVLPAGPWDGAVVLAGSVLLATVRAESVLGQVASGWMFPPERLSVSAGILAGVWAAAAGAAVMRWRWLAAAAASLGAVGEAAHLVLLFRGDPASLAVSWWPPVVAAVTMLAALVPLGRPGARPRPVSWPLLSASAGAGAGLAVVPLAQAMTTTVTRYRDGAAAASNPLWSAEVQLRIGLAVLLGVLLAVMLGRGLRAGLRREQPRTGPAEGASPASRP